MFKEVLFMLKKDYTNSQIIDSIMLFFSCMFLIAAFTGAIYTNQLNTLFSNWILLMRSPSPLVTDYFALGGLGSAYLNAAACGFTCYLFSHFLKGDSTSATLSGYFLVVAHCLYGLNFLNFWPCFLSTMLFIVIKSQNIKENLHICMFATSFGPFIGEFLFRYSRESSFVLGKMPLTEYGITLTILFSLVIGFIIPPLLTQASSWHKSYNLFNAGLAFGILGFFFYTFFYTTMNIPAPAAIDTSNLHYLDHNSSYLLFNNLFFLITFGICIFKGYQLNKKSFTSFKELIHDTGYQNDFSLKYQMPTCLINLGCCGLLFLVYLNVIMLYSDGAGFTGATAGVLIASLTFTAKGQHPRNIFPIMIGYQLLYFFGLGYTAYHGTTLSWSISSQGYINGVAFATGLAPIVSEFGGLAGIVAGFLCASMCTSTGAIHGRLVLYNGGFTAGLTALILVPILEHYFKPLINSDLKVESNMKYMLSFWKKK